MSFAVKPILTFTFILLSACDGNNRHDVKIDDSLICKAAIATLNNKNPLDLFSRFLHKWNYHSVVYIRESDGKAFNYYCRTLQGRVLIKSTLNENDSYANRLYYQIKNTKLLIKRSPQAESSKIKQFSLRELQK